MPNHGSRERQERHEEINKHVKVKTYVYIYIYGWWFQSSFIFHNIWDVILPIDFHMFQDG